MVKFSKPKCESMINETTFTFGNPIESGNNNYTVKCSDEIRAKKDIMSYNNGTQYQKYAKMLNDSNINKRKIAINFLNQWYELTLKEVTKNRKRNADIVKKSIRLWKSKKNLKIKSKKKVHFCKNIIMPPYNINEGINRQPKSILKEKYKKIDI